MTKFQSLIEQLDITRNITDEDIEKTITLLNLYGPTLRRAGRNIDDMEEECFESRRQSVSDFINLAIDFDHDADRKHIADRLSEMGHSMQLLNIMEDALVLLKSTPSHGGMYFDIIRTRYFDAYCSTNEYAFLALGISSSTYYRHIKNAIRAYAANLWCVVIPDLIIAEHKLTPPDSPDGSQMRVS